MHEDFLQIFSLTKASFESSKVSITSTHKILNAQLDGQVSHGNQGVTIGDKIHNGSHYLSTTLIYLIKSYIISTT
jgi:hypothetical protein